MDSEKLISQPIITDDFMVLGILFAILAFVFYTSSLEQKFWKSFYTIFPSLLLCYLIPSILSSIGFIAPEWHKMDENGTFLLDDNGAPILQKLNLYYVASRLLLPAALVLLILSIDMKALLSLGNKALIMFLTGTAGIILGGPIALMIVAYISPETVGGEGFDATWRGLSTIAGSWIGGGANQTAMLEIYKFNPDKFGSMILVDIIVANIWMAILLYGIGKKEKIDAWLKADNSAIEALKIRVSAYTESVRRMPSLKDYIILLGIVFVSVAFSHWMSLRAPQWIGAVFPGVLDPSNTFSTFGDKFFWLVSIATILGLVYSYTPLKAFEGMGASTLGSIFIYVLVATIGMKMDLRSIVDNPGLIVVGLIWMAVHATLLILVAKWIKAPFFFLAVGSQANVGGAASAPIVAREFHPSLASVGVLLAIFGYVIGTFGAILCAMLMSGVAPS